MPRTSMESWTCKSGPT